MPLLTVLRVFCDDQGRHGNPLGVFFDGAAVPEERRQAVAHELGYSETVFVDDAARGRVRIFTPATEQPFAGHPLVGTGWLLAERGVAVDVLRPPAGEVPTWADDAGLRWIRGRAHWAPPMSLVQLDSAAAVEALTGPPEPGFVDAWAWADEAAGSVRSRVFADELGIPEDEATGAAAVRLVAHLDRPIVIHQGRGSVLYARPGPDGTSDVGGRVLLDDEREYDVTAEETR